MNPLPPLSKPPKPELDRTDIATLIAALEKIAERDGEATANESHVKSKLKILLVFCF